MLSVIKYLLVCLTFHKNTYDSQSWPTKEICRNIYHRYVPRVLTDIMRSYLFMLVSVVLVSWMALALFTKMSIPPNVFSVKSTACFTCSSSRMSTTHGRHLPPQASTAHETCTHHHSFAKPRFLHKNWGKKSHFITTLQPFFPECQLFCPVRHCSRPTNNAWLMEQGLTSHQTHYRSYRGRFLQVIWPNQQCQSTEGNQLVFQIRPGSHQHHSIMLQ